MPILPSSGWLSGGNGGGGGKGGGSGDSGRSGSSGIFGGAFGIGKGGNEQRHNEGSRTMRQAVPKNQRVTGTGPNNDSRTRWNKSTGDKKEKEKKIPKGQEHKRSVTNKKDPRKLEKGETMIFQGDIVSKDPRGGWNINGTHFHDGAVPWEES